MWCLGKEYFRGNCDNGHACFCHLPKWPRITLLTSWIAILSCGIGWNCAEKYAHLEYSKSTFVAQIIGLSEAGVINCCYRRNNALSDPCVSFRSSLSQPTTTKKKISIFNPTLLHFLREPLLIFQHGSVSARQITNRLSPNIFTVCGSFCALPEARPHPFGLSPGGSVSVHIWAFCGLWFQIIKPHDHGECGLTCFKVMSTKCYVLTFTLPPPFVTNVRMTVIAL